MQQLSYDRDADAGYVKLASGTVASTVRRSDRLIVDYDDAGQIIGCELLEASAPLDLGSLTSVPELRRPLQAIHRRARSGTAVIPSAERRADALLAGMSALSGTLQERRLKVAAHAQGITDPLVRKELVKRGLLDERTE